MKNLTFAALTCLPLIALAGCASSSIGGTPSDRAVQECEIKAVTGGGDIGAGVRRCADIGFLARPRPSQPIHPTGSCWFSDGYTWSYGESFLRRGYYQPDHNCREAERTEATRLLAEADEQRRLAAPPALPAARGRTEVVLTRGGGTFEVPVIINGALQLNFTIDSGAADVIIPADVMLTLRQTGTLRDADILGKATYTLADGSQTSGLRFRIRSLKVGDRVLQDVEGGSAPITGGMLLGQSFLRRFRSWSMDNARGVLVLQ